MVETGESGRPARRGCRARWREGRCPAGFTNQWRQNQSVSTSVRMAGRGKHDIARPSPDAAETVRELRSRASCKLPLVRLQRADGFDSLTGAEGSRFRREENFDSGRKNPRANPEAMAATRRRVVRRDAEVQVHPEHAAALALPRGYNACAMRCAFVPTGTLAPTLPEALRFLNGLCASAVTAMGPS